MHMRAILLASLSLCYSTRDLAQDTSGYALTRRSLQNLEAFARLYGYVRFYHPTEVVRTTDWNAFAVLGVRAVEDCPSSDSLARTLRALFAPLAPTIQVLPSRV